MEKQASLALCNLIARGMSMAEAKAFLAPAVTPVAPVTPVARKNKPAPPTLEPDPEPETATSKPAWMP